VDRFTSNKDQNDPHSLPQIYSNTFYQWKPAILAIFVGYFETRFLRRGQTAHSTLLLYCVLSCNVSTPINGRDIWLGSTRLVVAKSSPFFSSLTSIFVQSDINAAGNTPQPRVGASWSSVVRSSTESVGTADTLSTTDCFSWKQIPDNGSLLHNHSPLKYKKPSYR